MVVTDPEITIRVMAAGDNSHLPLTHRTVIRLWDDFGIEPEIIFVDQLASRLSVILKI